MIHTQISLPATPPRRRHAVVWAVIIGFLAAAGISLAASPANTIQVTSEDSLLHMGSLDSFDITDGGKKAARGILDFLETGNPNMALLAQETYKRIIPDENFGGEYTALQWFCEYFLASEAEQRSMLEDPLTASFYNLFAKNDYAQLKSYLKRKYHLLSAAEEKGIDRNEERFLEDFILFSNPRRERWEKTSKIVEALPLKPGDSVADVGAGPGYYSFKFSKIVGDAGRVHAIEVNPRHIEYLSKVISQQGIGNVKVLRSKVNSIELSEPVDLAFLGSLYHVVYTYLSEEDRSQFVESIKKVLKPDGTLAIIDNALVSDSTLPYHGPYIAKELIIEQMRHYGFRLDRVEQYIPQRYVLLFKQAEVPPTGEVAQRNVEDLVGSSAPELVRVDSRKSLVHISGSRPSETAQVAAQILYSGLDQHLPEKVRTAREMFASLIPKENFGAEYTALPWLCDYYLAADADKPKLVENPLDRDFLRFFADNDWAVLKEFLVRRNNLGSGNIFSGDILDDALLVKTLREHSDPVSEFLWDRFSSDSRSVLTQDAPLTDDQRQRLVAQMNDVLRGVPLYDAPRFSKVQLSDETRKLLEENPSVENVQRLNRMLLTDAFPGIFSPLVRYGDLDDLFTREGNDRRVFLSDFIWFNNPRREEWEHTSKIIDILGLKSGDAVADVGSGPGFYSIRFADIVGENGRVYAIDTNEKHVDYVSEFAKNNDYGNVIGIKSKLNDIRLDDKVDTVFLCSLYHVIYATSMEKVKDDLIESIKRAMKPGSRLVIVDNDVLEPPLLRYHGSCIDPQLIVAQLKFYGFDLAEAHTISPQRYVLIFKLAGDGGAGS
jgi:predicted methyltransferase